MFAKLQCLHSFSDSNDMASAEQKEKWRQATQRYRDKKIALDSEAWREKERVRVAESQERHGPLTEEERIKINEVACLGMEEMRERHAV